MLCNYKVHIFFIQLYVKASSFVKYSLVSGAKLKVKRKSLACTVPTQACLKLPDIHDPALVMYMTSTLNMYKLPNIITTTTHVLPWKNHWFSWQKILKIHT